MRIFLLGFGTYINIHSKPFFFERREDYEKLHTFIDLYFKSNKKHENIAVALSNKEEFEINTEE